MPRAPFQVLVFPYRRRPDGQLEYALFRRADLEVWQGIAGGGEDLESPRVAATREAREEAGIMERALFPLTSMGRIPVEHFAGDHGWPAGLDTLPEYAFGGDVSNVALRLSAEHTSVEWFAFEDAQNALEWESNRQALRELHRTLEAWSHNEPRLLPLR